MSTTEFSETDQTCQIVNDYTRIQVSKEAGTINVFDREDERPVIAGAQFVIDRDTYPGRWTDEEAAHSVSHEPCNDAFGSGTRVRLTSTPTKGYGPERTLVLKLYDKHGFVSLGFEIHNQRKYPIRVASAHLLASGTLLPERVIDRPQVLRSGAGAERNVIRDGWQIDALNGAMLTWREGDARRTIVAGGLEYREFARRVELHGPDKRFGTQKKKGEEDGSERYVTLTAWDPHGKLVEPGASYASADSMYLDVATGDPFDALELYGRAMRTVNDASPNVYDFPTLCGWMVSTGLGERKPINNSPGLIEQMDAAREKGVLEYTPLAIRLEPDYYCYRDSGDTQQGWWDDEHFAKYKSLQEPYETFAKFNTALLERDGIPFTYFQVSMPSNDFAAEHPEWMLAQDVSRLHVAHPHHKPHVRYDYTNPEFREHVLKTWQRLRDAGLKGIKFDYPETGWNPHGGFSDATATTASAYRTIFELCREGLGADAFIHERILGGKTHELAPRTEVTAGVVDLQRVWGDASHFEPEMASRMGLRWFKSRVVFGYYPDGKSLFKPGTTEPLPTHERRTFLTLVAMLSGRLELGTSFSSMTPDMIHDVTRLYPMPQKPLSPRPVDMLTGGEHPQVYVYREDDARAQVILFNSDTEKTRTISAPLSGEQCEAGALGLKSDQAYHAHDFWNDRYVGMLPGTGTLSAELRPGECLIFSLREAVDSPQVISTNRHIMQGILDTADVVWDAGAKTLSGTALVAAGEPFELTMAADGFTPLGAEAEGENANAATLDAEAGLIRMTITSEMTGSVPWRVRFG